MNRMDSEVVDNHFSGFGRRMIKQDGKFFVQEKRLFWWRTLFEYDPNLIPNFIAWWDNQDKRNWSCTGILVELQTGRMTKGGESI